MFAKVNKYAAPFISAFPDIPPRGYTPDANSLLLTSYLTVDSSFTAVTLAAADAPPANVAGIQLLPPTMCAVANASLQQLMPSSVLNDNVLNPYFSISSSTDLPSLLEKVLASSVGIPAYLVFPPMLMQFSYASLQPLAASKAPLVFASDTIWMGPSVPTGTTSNGNPGSTVLDLAGVRAVIGVQGPDTGFFLQRLTLINPAEGAPPDPAGTSAIPLWAFHFDR